MSEPVSWKLEGKRPSLIYQMSNFVTYSAELMQQCTGVTFQSRPAQANLNPPNRWQGWHCTQSYPVISTQSPKMPKILAKSAWLFGDLKCLMSVQSSILHPMPLLCTHTSAEMATWYLPIHLTLLKWSVSFYFHLYDCLRHVKKFSVFSCYLLIRIKYISLTKTSFYWLFLNWYTDVYIIW